MKTRVILFIIYCVLYAKIVHASSDPLTPFYKMPSYIDLEYQAPEYSEISYGPKTKFHMLLREYKDSPQAGKIVHDDSARAASAKQEPDLYAKYLNGAENFNAAAYEDALKIFIELQSSETSTKEKLYGLFGGNKYSWVKEASLYMIARCQLIIAQNNWDGYSDPVESVDQNMLRIASDSYRDYLEKYPKGLYSDSARNIRRRILYLANNQEELDLELKSIMLSIFPITSNQIKYDINFNIVTEFENYFHGNIDVSHDSPILVAYAWLGDQRPQPEEIAILEARERDFAGYHGLFRYVRALGLYRLARYKELLDKTPEEMLKNNTLSLSTQLLRARSLLRLQKTDEALQALKKMHDVLPEDCTELEIAYLKLNSGDGLWLYTNESPIKIEKNLRSFAQFGLTDNDLEKSVDMKEIRGDKRKFLIDELARRYILTKRFKELSLLLTTEKGSGIFTPIHSVITMLAKNPNNAQALSDVGEFLYQNYITPTTTFQGYESSLRSGDAFIDLSSRCQPCKDFQDRTQSYVPPIAFFYSAAEIIQKSGRKSEAEAKALYYIVRCGRQGGEFEARCNWRIKFGEQSDGSSKAAFMKLHKKYKESTWAAKTPYYY